MKYFLRDLFLFFGFVWVIGINSLIGFWRLEIFSDVLLFFNVNFIIFDWIFFVFLF